MKKNANPSPRTLTFRKALASALVCGVLSCGILSCRSSKPVTTDEPMDITTYTNKKDEVPAAGIPPVEGKTEGDAQAASAEGAQNGGTSGQGTSGTSGTTGAQSGSAAAIPQSGGASAGSTNAAGGAATATANSQGKAADAKAAGEAEQWKKNHRAIIAKSASSVTADDLAAIQNALDGYDALSGAAKSLVQGEYADLRNKLAKAQADSAAAAAKAKAAAEKLKSDNGALFAMDADSVTADDLAALQNALGAYEKLSDAEKALLQSEFQDLQNKLGKAQADANARAKAEDEAKRWSKAHSAIIKKILNSITANDLSAIQKALGAYEKLSGAAQAFVQGEHADLQEKLGAAQADSAARDEAARWKQSHAAIIAKSASSVTADDLAAIQDALDGYDALSGAAKPFVQGEYADLQAKLAKAQADSEAKAKAKSAAEAKQWKKNHNAILKKNANSIMAEDLPAIAAALGSYDALSGEAQALVQGEHADLQEKLGTAQDDAAARDEAARWKQSHAAIIAKSASSVTADDLAAVQDALDGYDALSGAAKAFAQGEHADLQNKLARAQAKAKSEADQWKKNHKAIIAKKLNSVTANDLAAIQKALDAYEKLSGAAKALVQSEYADLQDKLAKAQADAGTGAFGTVGTAGGSGANAGASANANAQGGGASSNAGSGANGKAQADASGGAANLGGTGGKTEGGNNAGGKTNAQAGSDANTTDGAQAGSGRNAAGNGQVNSGTSANAAGNGQAGSGTSANANAAGNVQAGSGADTSANTSATGVEQASSGASANATGGAQASSGRSTTGDGQAGSGTSANATASGSGAKAGAQGVAVTSELSTEPMVVVGNTAAGNGGQWGFRDGRTLREQVAGEATTADGRATFAGEVAASLAWRDRFNAPLLDFSPRWNFSLAESSFGARLKPFDWLEITLTNGKLKQTFGPKIHWESDALARQISIIGITGAGEERNGNEAEDGVYAAYTGVEGLWVGGGIAMNAWRGGSGAEPMYGGASFVKKGAWGPFQFGVKYSAELFEAGAKWVGQFGKFDGADAETTDANWSSHDVYAGITFKGLENAKYPTLVGVGAELYAARASAESPVWLKAAAWAVSASVRTSFNNSISNTLALTVGYESLGGEKAKVLPFYVGDTFVYQVSSEARFALYAAYEQMGLPNAMKGYQAPKSTGSASAVLLKPSFSYTAGRHMFSIGVDTRVFNSLSRHGKTGSDWAYSTISGEFATVSLPISWTYRF